MHVKISGEKRGDTLDLTEEMTYSDGEKRKYIWKFTRQNDRYVGHRADLVGPAKITQNPHSVEIAYQANIVLPKGGEQVLDFVETLTFDTQESARLQIKISKFFVPVANAELVVKKIASAK
jgi:ribosomal protein S3